jgi:site-specific DNA-methyltransferase (adenine-specific)
LTRPYWTGDGITLYLGDCREVTAWLAADVLVTDPPYPNNAGWFDDAVGIAEAVLSGWRQDAISFWNELTKPPIPVPLVAVHIWHRTNVNGRPYEPAFQFATDGQKRRSDVIRHAQIHSGVGPGSAEYFGHPTQKPEAVMRVLIRKTTGIIADPFAGTGPTLLAARSLGRTAIGVEIDERYCEMAARRLDQGILAPAEGVG